MLKLFVVIRWFFALILLIFGTVELFELHQEEFSGNAKTVIEGLRASGYIFPVIGLVEIMVGLSLIMNRFVPFALLFLVPITLNFMLFHMFVSLEPGLAPALVIFVLHVLLIAHNFRYYIPLISHRRTK